MAALNGLAVIQAYFRIFTGRPRPSTIDLQVRPSERASVLIISALILVGGLFPQFGVSNRYRAALKLAGLRSHEGSPDTQVWPLSQVKVGLDESRAPR